MRLAQLVHALLLNRNDVASRHSVHRSRGRQTLELAQETKI